MGQWSSSRDDLRVSIDDLGFHLVDAEAEVHPLGSMGGVVSGYLDIYGVLKECFLGHQDQWSTNLQPELHYQRPRTAHIDLKMFRLCPS